MFRFIGLCLGTLVRLLRERRSLLLENLALRQQLAVLKRRHPRPRLDLVDKLFWVAVRRFWSGWQQSLIAVTPETVVRWHRGRFLLYWKLISKVRRPVGRRQTSKEVQELIFRMVGENPTWGAPRIHGELLMLGFDVSERTISRWMKREQSIRQACGSSSSCEKHFHLDPLRGSSSLIVMPSMDWKFLQQPAVQSASVV
jgi:hypothetical protein